MLSGFGRLYRAVARSIRSGFWFLPSVMTIIALIAAPLTVALDEVLKDSELNQWLPGPVVGIEGARLILSTVAASMITVASLVFSMTLVALTLISQQLGPRVLLIVMEDRPTQAVLGVFIASFMYSLLVLGTVGTGPNTDFLPHLSVFIACALAMAAFALMIYFVHHIATIIQADAVIADLGKKLLQSADTLSAKQADNSTQLSREDFETVAGEITRFGQEIGLPTSGYVTTVDEDGLLALAEAHELRIVLRSRPGHFVLEGIPVISAQPDGLDRELLDRISSNVVFGPRRTRDQHVEFEINALVEVALRALSPGINDPYTAMTCVDRLSDGLAKLLNDQMSLRALKDQSGVLRVLPYPQDYAHYLDTAIHPLRHAGGSNLQFILKLVRTLGSLARLAKTEEQRTAINLHLDSIAATVKPTLQTQADRDSIAHVLQAARPSEEG